MGIIGSGSRGVKNLGRKIIEKQRETRLLVEGVYDRFAEQADAAEAMLNDAYAARGVEKRVRRFASYQELIDDPAIHAVMVTTPQYFHMPPVVYALERGKKVFCEKPIAHTLEDAERMYEAWTTGGRANAVVGFTRRYENAWIRAKQLIDQGWVGDVTMILLRSIIPYWRYFQKWHGKRELSGDILNEKSAHHFDVLNWFAGSRAEQISAMGGRTTLAPREGYPHRCANCDLDCPYRQTADRVAADQTDNTGLAQGSADTDDRLLLRDICVYSPDNDILDHAIVNVGYANGVKAQLFLNVAGQRADDQETLEVVGTKGRLVLTRHAGTIRVIYNYGAESMEIDARSKDHSASHFGADYVLIRALADFIHGVREPEVTLEEGYLATRMAAAALRSVEQLTVERL